MVLRSVALFSALSAASGKSVELPTGDIAASSKLGSRILSQVSRAASLAFDFGLNGQNQN